MSYKLGYAAWIPYLEHLNCIQGLKFFTWFRDNKLHSKLKEKTMFTIKAKIMVAVITNKYLINGYKIKKYNEYQFVGLESKF